MTLLSESRASDTSGPLLVLPPFLLPEDTAGDLVCRTGGADWAAGTGVSVTVGMPGAEFCFCAAAGLLALRPPA